MGLSRGGTYPGHHPSMALARDWMTSSATKHAQLTSALWANRKALHLWYLISRRRIISMTRPGAGWQPYTRSNPHTDHVHGSFYPAALSAIVGALVKGGNMIGGFLAPVIDYVAQLKDKFAGPLGKLKDKVLDSPFGTMIAKMPRMLADRMMEKIKTVQEAVQGAAGTAGNFIAAGFGSNRAIGKTMMLQRWGASEWPPLNSLWTRESGWRTTAKNPSSGAYGIPQALPASKMASAGADWLRNPRTQIKWGLGYIASRYGSPSAAWAHSQRTGWYDRGGFMPPGWSATLNSSRKPEPVLTDRQWSDIHTLARRGAEATNGMAGNIYVQMNVSIDDLDKMSKVGDFVKMLQMARVNSRKTLRSGTVAS
jgi:hypothetical protein